MKNYGKLVAGLIAAWFVAALSASSLHLFKNDASRIGTEQPLGSLQVCRLPPLRCGLPYRKDSGSSRGHWIR
jgi:hypothetical protein